MSDRCPLTAIRLQVWTSCARRMNGHVYLAAERDWYSLYSFLSFVCRGACMYECTIDHRAGADLKYEAWHERLPSSRMGWSVLLKQTTETRSAKVSPAPVNTRVNHNSFLAVHQKPPKLGHGSATSHHHAPRSRRSGIMLSGHHSVIRNPATRRWYAVLRMRANESRCAKPRSGGMHAPPGDAGPGLPPIPCRKVGGQDKQQQTRFSVPALERISEAPGIPTAAGLPFIPCFNTTEEKPM